MRTIANDFAEALGCLEDTLYLLGQVNEQYDPDYPNDYDPPPRNRAMDFWLQAELAEDKLKKILRKLQRVEPLAPKAVEPLKEREP